MCVCVYAKYTIRYRRKGLWVVERERERERQTDRQAGRQAGRQTETEIERETDRPTDRDRVTERDRVKVGLGLSESRNDVVIVNKKYFF